MKKLISIILLSAMLFTACGKEDASVETTVSETTAAVTAATEEASFYADFIPQDDFGQMLIGEKISEFVDDGAVPEILTGERAEKLENAVICSWAFTSLDICPFPTGIMGVSCNDKSAVSGYYTGYEQDESIYKYTGIAEKDGEEYLCNMVFGDTIVTLSAYPRSASPEIYDEFVNSQ